MMHEGRLIWVADLECPAGHKALRDSWDQCKVCRYACVHYVCRVCEATVRSPDHEHRY